MNEINRFLSEYFSDERLKQLSPIEINTSESFTIQPLDEFAFSLQAISGYSRQIRNDTELSNGVVVRTVVPYSQFRKMQDNSSQRLYYFSILINSMLTTATVAVGDLTFRRLTIGRPGENDYLRDLENTAGYEFRLFVYPKEQT